MRVEGITNIISPIRAYAIPRYQNFEKVPPIEKIDKNFFFSSEQIQKMDLFRFYAKQGIQNHYPKGQVVDLTL
ncbi:MAG: hypothetical protein RMI35_03260 [Leptospiraceae bacterium]|nr:hypothetical protein [Leptospiraceae bacterium]